VPRRSQAVEKVAGGSIDGPKSGQKPLKIGVLVLNLGQKRSITGVFQHAGIF
jgi:hypothetical protein